jgi:hypothetical protein
MRTRNLGALRISLVALAALGMLLIGAGLAFADGNGAQTQTFTVKNAQFDMGPALDPCSGMSGQVLGTSVNGVLHQTINGAGDFWLTGTLTGASIFVPDSASMPTYVGHGETWFGVSDNNQNGVEHFTFHFQGTAPDGTTMDFHEIGHISTSASSNGLPVVVFDKATGTCG